MARDVQDRNRTDVGQADSRTVNIEHFICARANSVGCQSARDGNGGGDADDGDAYRFHARRGAAVWRCVSLLSRTKLRRHRNDFHQGAEFRGAGLFLSLTVWSNHGAFALVVSQELLPLLHGGRVRDLSRAGLRSVLQTWTRRTSVPAQSTRAYHGRVCALRREASGPRDAVHACCVPTRSGARVWDGGLSA